MYACVFRYTYVYIYIPRRPLNGTPNKKTLGYFKGTLNNLSIPFKGHPENLRVPIKAIAELKEESNTLGRFRNLYKPSDSREKKHPKPSDSL